ncbi:hypothetical protein [Ferroplasma sp.]|uniref:hypothetical protein n=1 Tax=Ferroplasma sp. TaxID=2591003 RepID=UPI00307FBD44
MISKYFIKNIISSKRLWAFGVFFMIFWLFMGAYVFGFVSYNQSTVLYSSSVWFGIISVVAVSTLAITVALSIYYASFSLSYAFKFSKLKPYQYTINFMLASAIMGTIMGIVMMVFTSLFFGNKSGYKIIPKFPLEILGISALGSIFMFLLAMLLIIAVNNYLGLKNVSFVSFIPLLLTYIFGFTQLSIKLPEYLIYLSPFTEISDLLFYLFDGHSPRRILDNPASSIINPYYLAFYLSMWIVIFFIVDIILLKRIKPANIEEARQV